MPDSTVATLQAAIGRWPHSANEIIGSAARRSCSTNSTAQTMNSANSNATRVLLDVAGVGQAHHQRADRHREKRGAGEIDRRARVPLVSCRNTMKPAAEARPIGTLIQKIHAHDRSRIMQPPTIGPITAAMAHTLAR